MAGESGAADVAGLLACLDSPELREKLELNEESNVLVVNTEGVTDRSTFNQIIGYDVFE
jgi:diaminopropionate ammonia-lyase